MSGPGSEQYSAAWEQFLIGRREMLAEYDQSRAHSKQLAVQTWHGPAAESAFRAWLESFLPKRFGVTPGYIRGQRLRTPFDYAHFDVIVYDQINSPVLWVETTKDKADRGRARIIPAEHVHAILEVKAALTRESARAAAEKLRQLEPLMDGVDAPGEPYPTYLPVRAVLGSVFFELRKESAEDTAVLETVRDLLDLRRAFYGAVILRGDQHSVDQTGLIRLTVSETASTQLASDAGLLGGFSQSATVERKGQYYGAMLSWSAVHFSEFAFDLLAIMRGTYRRGFTSSWHGLDLTKFPKSPDGA